MIEELLTATLPDYRKYNLDNVHDFYYEEALERSKKARMFYMIMKRIWDIYDNRLMCRTFVIAQYMSNRGKTVHTYCREIRRELAGESKALVNRGVIKTGFSFNYYGNYRNYDVSFDYRDRWEVTNFDSYNVNKHMLCRQTENTIEINDPYELVKNTMHKYCGIDTVKLDYDLIMEYLIKYHKHPEMEMFMKLGLYKYFENKHIKLNDIRWKAKGFNKLGILASEIHYLDVIPLAELKQRIERLRKWKFNNDELKVWKDSNYTFDKKQVRYCINHRINAREYKDQLRLIEELGLPKRNEYLYPANFHESHIQISDMYKIKNGTTDNEKIISYARDLSKYVYNSKDYIIRPAANLAELINESKELNHCVRTYSKSVANRTTSIFFIRKKDEEDIPFVTLELKNNNVIQVRAKSNRDPEEDVINFVSNWANKNHIKYRRL